LNDWVWVQAGSDERYGPLSSHLLAKFMAICQIRDRSQDTVWPLAGIPILSPVNSGRPSVIHNLIIIRLREDV